MRRMKHTQQAWWLNLTASIIGFDDNGDGGGAGDGGAGDGGDGGDASGAAGDGDGSAAGDGGASSGGEDVSGLKSALEKERTDRKALEKELKGFRTAAQTKADAEKTEVQRLTDANAAAIAKTTKLAEGFKTSAVRTAVLEAAGKAKFRDATDALTADVLAAIGVEQDEDDPTQVTIDAATVTEAIKQLAKKKPHYLATTTPAGGQGGGTPSGSKFGGSNNNGKVDPTKAALAERYPALRGRIGN
jgi:hypothetical protein